MDDIKKRLKEIETTLEKRKSELQAEIEACEVEKEESKKKAEACLNDGDVKGRVKNLDLFLFNKARIERLQEELESGASDELKAEAEELIKEAQKEVRRKIKENENIYFEFLTKAKVADKETDKAIVSARNVIRRCEKITNNKISDMMSNPFKGMLESTNQNVRFFEAWQRLNKRR